MEFYPVKLQNSRTSEGISAPVGWVRVCYLTKLLKLLIFYVMAVHTTSNIYSEKKDLQSKDHLWLCMLIGYVALFQS